MEGRARGSRWAAASWAVMGLVGIPALVLLDPPGGWRWVPHDATYDPMIVSIYAAVAISSLWAIGHPSERASFLRFVVLSSLTRGGVTLSHALAHPGHLGHRAGDVWILADGLGLAIPLQRARRPGPALIASGPAPPNRSAVGRTADPITGLAPSEARRRGPSSSEDRST